VTAIRYLFNPHNMMNNSICRSWCTLGKRTTTSYPDVASTIHSYHK